MNLFDKIVYDLFLKENNNENNEAPKNSDSNKSQIETLINHQSHKKNKGYVFFISFMIVALTLSMFAIIYSMKMFNTFHTYKPNILYTDYTYTSNNPYVENYTLNNVEHVFRVKITHNAVKVKDGYTINHTAFLYLDDELIVEDNPAFNGFISNYYPEHVDRYDKNEFNNKNFEYTYSVYINVLKDLQGKEYAVISFIPKDSDTNKELYLLIINDNNELIYNTRGIDKVYYGLEKNEDNAFGVEGRVNIDNNKVYYVSLFDGNLAHVNEITIDNNKVIEVEVETFTAITG